MSAETVEVRSEMEENFVEPSKSLDAATQTSSKSDVPPNAGTSRKETPAYHLKWIKFRGNKCPVITQNENGPCPVIAVMNVLLLRGRIKLPSVMEIITSQQLMEYLGDCILSTIPKNVPEGVQLNYEQNMHDAIAILPKLQTGLDVNVKFTGISQFEYTPELIVFDLLHIPLYHGWLIDPDQPEVVSAVGNCSYNQLVDKVITNKASSEADLVAEALLLEQFLEKTASQLTYRGLSELKSKTKEDKLGVLFRNNHFITLYKHKNELYQLVTDQGFLTENDVVWETLRNIDNDDQFVDSEFVPVPPKTSAPINSQQQVDQDYLIALSLQEEAKKESETQKEWETFKAELGVEGLNDEELARRLQSEEEKRFQKYQQQQQSKSENKSEKSNGKPQSLPHLRKDSEQQERKSSAESDPSSNKTERRDDEGRGGKTKPVCLLM